MVVKIPELRRASQGVGR